MQEFKFIIAITSVLSIHSAQGQFSAVGIFDEYWQVMKDNYAFFDLRGLDWQSQKHEYRGLIHSTTTEDELFNLMYQMIRPLNDGHTYIVYNGNTYRSNGKLEIWKYASPSVNLIKEKYVKNLQETANKSIRYGWVNESIGYIGISRMEGYSPNVIDTILSVLTSARDIVIDVRYNGGGEDMISLDLAGRFADQKHFVYSKETYYKGVMGEHKDLYIHPNGINPHFRNIYLLTNNATFSAAEMFVMAMVSIPNCISVGENTAGAHSDVKQLVLSNGWEIGLSNQIYTMPDQKVYERYGIPPDVSVQEFHGNDVDEILETACKMASKTYR